MCILINASSFNLSYNTVELSQIFEHLSKEKFLSTVATKIGRLTKIWGTLRHWERTNQWHDTMFPLLFKFCFQLYLVSDTVLFRTPILFPPTTVFWYSTVSHTNFVSTYNCFLIQYCFTYQFCFHLQLFSDTVLFAHLLFFHLQQFSDTVLFRTPILFPPTTVFWYSTVCKPILFPPTTVFWYSTVSHTNFVSTYNCFLIQ